MISSTFFVFNAVWPYGQDKFPQVIQCRLVCNIVYAQFPGPDR